ncbi:hypothetical protein BaRGS_00012772 [Batillaria attramentaria]|uniref:Uncharacterized protein n=1 Tax=Batillaria attramentaria TaxID=370345 RepID=A0ABD0L9U9_9CAEN
MEQFRTRLHEVREERVTFLGTTNVTHLMAHCQQDKITWKRVTECGNTANSSSLRWLTSKGITVPCQRPVNGDIEVQLTVLFQCVTARTGLLEPFVLLHWVSSAICVCVVNTRVNV